MMTRLVECGGRFDCEAVIFISIEMCCHSNLLGEHCTHALVTKADTDSGEDNAYSLQKGASKKT